MRIGVLIQVVAGLVGSKIKPEQVFASLKAMKDAENRELVKRAKEGRPDYQKFLESILPLAGRPEDGFEDEA